jgi:ABC-2 type transport system permease protein
MTLFLRELKGNIKSFIIWTACIIVLTAMFMAMYPSFADQGDAVNDMLSGFSPELMQMFGFEAIDFTQTMDYYAYIFQYVLLATLIQFMILGANLLSKEEDSGTINFLYSKPLSRSSIVGTKFLAGFAQIAVFFVVNTSAAVVILSAVNKTGVDFGATAMLGLAMALGQLMVMGLGMLLSMFIVKSRAVMSASIGVVLVLYVASMFVSMNSDLGWLKYLTPFKYFDARHIIANVSLEWLYAVLAAGAALAGFALSLVIYNRRDLKC